MLVSDSALVALCTADINSFSVIFSFSSKDSSKPVVSETAIFSYSIGCKIKNFKYFTLHGASRVYFVSTLALMYALLIYEFACSF